jgi:hypothetical protein
MRIAGTVALMADGSGVTALIIADRDTPARSRDASSQYARET